MWGGPPLLPSSAAKRTVTAPQGRISVPLWHVIRRRQVRDTWPLQGVPQGSVTLELSWLGAMAP